MIIEIDFNSEEALYLQLCNQIIMGIATSRFREGDPLNWKADISRMKALGYRKTTDMKSALEEYCEWVKGEWGQK